ncbi:hypothetical protein ACFPMF_22035 [Larkinella bovis]|uniref:Lipoprotein n=1 Tax=Larkinella bovis TaxID=683041 RepID=A0ABW0II07_9BACT
MLLLRPLFIVLIYLGLLGCKEPSSKPVAPSAPVTTVYRIKAGEQSSDHEALTFTTKTSLSFNVTFDNSAIYTSKLAENQNDINKLYGFSDCNTHHQTASARFGWNWRDDSLRIYAYCYRNGERFSQELGTAELNQPANYKLSIVGDKYVFTFKGQETTFARGCPNGQNTNRYRLFPYFGGDEVAPHTITITITE